VRAHTASRSRGESYLLPDRWALRRPRRNRVQASSILNLSENALPATICVKYVCTSILLAETVYFTKPSPPPGVFFPISLAKYGASATSAGCVADWLTL